MKRGPKRNRHQRASDQKQAAEQRAEGKSLQAIGDQLGLSREQVRLDLAFVDQQLLESAKSDLELFRSQAIAKLRQVQVESFSAWRLSLEDAEKKTVKHTHEGTEETFVTEGQSGNPGHIRNLTKAIEAEAKLLGLYELGSGKGDEAAERLLSMHQLLETLREGYTHDPQKAPTTEPGAT